MLYITESTDSNADSTLDVSSAEVSMYIMPFSAVRAITTARAKGKASQGARKALTQRRCYCRVECQGQKRTGKGRGHFGGDGAKRSQVRLVSDEHGDDVWVCVLAQLFDPGFDVAEGRGLCDVVQQQRAKSSAVESEGCRFLGCQYNGE